MEKIYKEYDNKIVESNKKLPKPCYGNSNGYYCNYTCDKRNGCYGVTMKKWGKCDCEFKPSCHISRQIIQHEWKEKDSSHVCDFLEFFDKETYPIVIVPDGIIKMNPIVD